MLERETSQTRDDLFPPPLLLGLLCGPRQAESHEIFQFKQLAARSAAWREEKAACWRVEGGEKQQSGQQIGRHSAKGAPFASLARGR